MTKDNTAQSEDVVAQSPSQKAEHQRRMKASAERNAAKLKRQPNQPKGETK